ncbi:HMA domain-containing protein [Nephila pilipes]|uniref:Copper transport protein ATOX1 n=1 Tax=Nephila pilipes TaxID=299642 RepID=A0A8X6NZM8_NEPPI|nr:HMA domain-containing protein [Nephila pilipes]
MPNQVHEFSVDMTCEGCSSAIIRILARMKDIEDYNVDLAGKRVIVVSSLPVETLLETLKKSGKETTYIGVK